MTTSTYKSEPKPLWILSERDLSPYTSPGRYRVKTPDGTEKETTLSNRKRQVVDTLAKNEMFCASTVRIGSTVCRLKAENDLHIETKTLSNGRKYYALGGIATRIDADDQGGAS